MGEDGPGGRVAHEDYQSDSDDTARRELSWKGHSKEAGPGNYRPHRKWYRYEVVVMDVVLQEDGPNAKRFCEESYRKEYHE